jgi:mRNA interferase MazF
MNRYLQTVVIAPITSQSKPYPTRIEITINGKPNWVVLDQIRTIDKSRILKFLHLLDDSEIAFIKRAIQATFVN